MLQSQSVLLVEDMPEISRACALLFEIAGAKVRIVETAAEAMAAVREYRPDVIVADMHLPSGQCTALWGALKDLSDPRVPMIIMNGDGAARREFKAGKSAQMPFETAELILALTHVVSRQRGSDANSELAWPIDAEQYSPAPAHI